MTFPLHTVTAIVLAGGKSRRMGHDKALLEWRGQTLLQTITSQLRPHVAEVVVLIRDQVWDSALPVRWVFDAPGRSDAWGAIVTGLETIQTDWAFVCAVDMPGLHLPLIGHLAELAHQGTADAVVPEGPKGLEPLHSLYHRRCHQPMALAHDHGQRRLQELERFLPITRVPLESLKEANVWTDWALGNANTPGELAALDKLLP